MTLNLLSWTVFLGSDGSILVEAATRAMLSSGATATLCGGATPEPRASSWPKTLGGDTPRATMVTLSGGGFSTILVTPSTLMTLVSFDDTASCAFAVDASAMAARHRASTRSMRLGMRCAQAFMILLL